MKRKIVISLVLILVMILGFYGLAFAPGGGNREDPACDPDNLPAPTSGPILNGIFTVALDQSYCGLIFWEHAHYDVHVLLRGNTRVHLFSFTGYVLNESICEVTEAELKDLYNRTPCDLGVGKAFGIAGVPVIYSIKIQNRDFCQDQPPETCPYSPCYIPKRAMISGKISVRIVPLPK